MNPEIAKEHLGKALEKLPQLKQLHYDDPEFDLWKDGIEDVLKAVFGENADEYQRFHKAWGPVHIRQAWGDAGDGIEQDDHLKTLGEKEKAIKSILQKMELLGIQDKEAPTKSQELFSPKVFVAHGGEPLALSKLEEFLMALGCEPVIAEKEPSEGRSVNETG